MNLNFHRAVALCIASLSFGQAEDRKSRKNGGRGVRVDLHVKANSIQSDLTSLKSFTNVQVGVNEVERLLLMSSPVMSSPTFGCTQGV